MIQEPSFIEEYQGWKDPKIIIGGVPIVEQPFSWALIPGATPYIMNIMIPLGPLNDLLLAVPNPTEIHVEVYGGTRSQPEKQEFSIKEVFLIQPREQNPINAVWQVADKRFAWRGQKLFFSYNKTREKNDIIRAFEGLPETDPSKIREATDKYNSGRYLPWTVKENGSPYSMLEIAGLELAKLGITIDPEDFAVENKSYIIENVEMSGTDIYNGLNSLLMRSRLGLSVTLLGDIEVYSVDFFDNSPEDLIAYLSNLLPTQPNKLYRQDLSRTRPERIKIHFEKKIETKLSATSSELVTDNTKDPMPISINSPSITQDNITKRQVIGCENVIPVPYPYSDAGGKLWNVGEYVPMWKYLKDQNLSEAIVNQYYFSDMLAVYFAQKQTGTYVKSRLSLAFHIANTIKKHYRQTYQIDPFYMDRIKKWEARRVAVTDNYSRFSPPSPLWADYCVAPNARIPLVAKKLAIWSPVKYYNWFIDIEDADRERPTAGSIGGVNQALGIFRVKYPVDVTRNIKQIIPSAIDNSTVPGVVLQALQTQITSMHLSAEHKLETLVSIIWNTDRFGSFNSRGNTLSKSYSFQDFTLADPIWDNKYRTIDLDYQLHLGKGPDIEYLSRLDYARFRYPDIVEGAQVIEKDANNIGNIEAMAQSEGAKLINQYIDRVSGNATYAGAVTGQLKLIGNIKSIIYTFSPGKGLETRLTLSEHVPTPTTEQTLPQDALNFVQRQVTRAGEQNEIGAAK